MKTIIKATAPTTYQLNSIRAFGMPVQHLRNGSHYAEMEFADRDEAKEYLRTRADLYYQQGGCNDSELQEMLKEIEMGTLRLDAVSAYIEEIED